MAYADTRLDNEQKDLLKDLVGKRLEAIHFSPCASEFCAWEWVWLEFEDRIVEVSNGIEAVEYFGPTEDVSVFRVRQVEPVDPNKHLEGKQVRRFTIGETVNEIFLVEDERFRHHGEELIDTFVVTDAIALKMESQDICIKKTVWFSEMADISFGPDFMELLNDVTYDFDDADEEAESGNALSVRRTVQGVGSFDPLVIIETQKGGCPECGGDALSINEFPSLVIRCLQCGMSIASTKFLPIDLDENAYRITLGETATANVETIAVVAKIATCNYLQAKALIESPSTIFEGRARDVREKAALLKEAGIPFSIEPEWRY